MFNAIIPVVQKYAPNAIRHLGQLAAGGLLSGGFATESESTIVAGVAVAVLTYVWSVVEKRYLTKLAAA
jgi:hypothetical protein